jgi:hypothetical protein
MREEGAAENLASAIYGTILSTALIAAYSEDPGSDPLQVAVAVVVTSLVFWIAHAYAGVLARGAEPGHGMALVGAELAASGRLSSDRSLPPRRCCWPPRDLYPTTPLSLSRSAPASLCWPAGAWRSPGAGAEGWPGWRSAPEQAASSAWWWLASRRSSIEPKIPELDSRTGES